MFISTKEKAKLIRKELKDLKIKASVRCKGGSIDITLKEFAPLSKAQEIGKKYEHYMRCQATGEILEGGNTFVFVDYDDDLKELPFAIVEICKKAAKTFPIDEHYLVERSNIHHRGEYMSEIGDKNYNADDYRALFHIYKNLNNRG